MIKLGYQLFHTFNMDHDNIVRCTVFTVFIINSVRLRNFEKVKFFSIVDCSFLTLCLNNYNNCDISLLHYSGLLPAFYRN